MISNSSKTKDLIKGMIIYAIGNFGTKILSFLIVPLYTYYISTEDMGMYDLLKATMGLLAPVITLQISDAAFRWMVRADGSKESYIRSTIQVLVFNAFMMSILILIFSWIFPFAYKIEFILLLMTSRGVETIQKLLRGLKNQWLFTISGMLYTIIFLVLNILQICVFDQGVKALFTSAIISNIVTLIVIFGAEKQLRINIFHLPNMGLIKEMVKFSAPLIPNYLNWWVISSSDRYIVRFFVGNAANGIYAIAYKFPTVLQLILGLFNTSWQDLSVADKDIDTGKYYSQIFQKLYIFSFSFLWLLIPITKIFIVVFMEQSYRDAASYVSFLYMGTVFQSFSSFYGVGYLRNKNTKQASMTSIYGAVINAVINIAFIQFIGLYAAAISTFIGFMMMWIIREKQNRLELGVYINKTKFVFYSIITFCLSVVSCWTTNWIDGILLIIGSIAFIFVNREDIGMIIIKVQKKLQR